MRHEDIVATQEACRLLKISRPTKRDVLKARDKKYQRLRVAA